MADPKLITHENMAHIIDNDGFFIAPAPMYESYKNVFEEALNKHDHELLIPYKERFNRGFEVPMEFSHEGKTYQLRMIILYDHGLRALKQKALQNRIQKTLDGFEELSGKLNRYKLKTREQITAACATIFKKNKTESFFSYTVTNNPVTTYKNSRRGKPSANSEKIAEVHDHFTVYHEFDKNAFEKALAQCGYYPLLTNKSADQLSIADAMQAHKNQYKCEHTFRRAKGPYNVEPIYLHTPERIEAFLFLFKIALQILVLIERTARNNIDERERGAGRIHAKQKGCPQPAQRVYAERIRRHCIGTNAAAGRK